MSYRRDRHLVSFGWPPTHELRRRLRGGTDSGDDAPLASAGPAYLADLRPARLSQEPSMILAEDDAGELPSPPRTCICSSPNCRPAAAGVHRLLQFPRMPSLFPSRQAQYLALMGLVSSGSRGIAASPAPLSIQVSMSISGYGQHRWSEPRILGVHLLFEMSRAMLIPVPALQPHAQPRLRYRLPVAPPPAAVLSSTAVPERR